MEQGDAISRSAVLDRLEMLRRNYTLKAGYRDAMTDAIGEVRDALTIDAVPVVRCKDCVHSAPLEGYASRKFEIGLNCRACRGDSGYGIVGLSFTVPDGYCDDGLRRAGEAE